MAEIPEEIKKELVVQRFKNESAAVPGKAMEVRAFRNFPDVIPPTSITHVYYLRGGEELDCVIAKDAEITTKEVNVVARDKIEDKE